MDFKNYCEYLEVNETYFPCIDDSAIHAGVDWMRTYPHETFITLLNDTEKMLGGNTKRSLWIHGAYGTGKSQCAYALKRILEEPQEKVREYWERYDALSANKALLEKLLGHKENGVITAWRYASGSITSPQQLFFAVQESVKKALDEIPNSYKGENTLKESVIAWLQDGARANFVNELLQKPEWKSKFSQATAEEIVNTLSKDGEISELMENLFLMANREGITALSLSADSLCEWIKDVVSKNKTKIVLIWDEFSGFFRQNRNSLDEFQKIVSLCQETHFYFVIVTHPITSIAGASVSKDDPMSVVQQRYTKVEISLPSNIAFELTGHAFDVKKAAKNTWEELTGDLDSRITSAKMNVMRASGVGNEKVMKRMLPIHPMAALVLKNIASAFQSNQRSMFDFIKTPKDLNAQAFQWFIQNTSPYSERPLLTIDMLWDFFYDKGKDSLSSDIKLILDTFPQQNNLTAKEKIVLKTILIMQAVDQRLGGSIALLKPTDQNLDYAFEGDDEYAVDCKSIAKALVTKGVLMLTPIADGKKVYAAAVLAGDGAKIDKLKEEVSKTSTTIKLTEEGAQVACALNLTPALRLRYAETGALRIVTNQNFARVMEELKSKDLDWQFHAVLAVAKTEEEAQNFRNLISRTMCQNDYQHIAVVDALSSPLGWEAFNTYVEYAAMSMYYNGNNNQQSKEYARKAKEVLEREWKERIRDGQLIVWSYDTPEGEKAIGSAAVHKILEGRVLKRFKFVPDFAKSLTETQLKLTQAKNCAKYGFADIEVSGLIKGCEKSVLGKVWGRENYWSDVLTKDDGVSVVKRAVDKMIVESFEAEGRISIDAIYDFLESTYGYGRSNLTAFVVGFLLKEYRNDPYRFQDSEGHRESMSPDKLAEMIGNYMSKKVKSTYIVSLTPEEKAFYDLTDVAWGINASSACTSPTQAGTLIQTQMRQKGYPAWTLGEIATTFSYDIVKMYLQLIQGDARTAHDLAIKIGKIALERPSAKKELAEFLANEKNYQLGMEHFLERFENGALPKLAKEIGAKNRLLADVKQLFCVKHSALWDVSTGEDELRKLLIEYGFVKVTNQLLNIQKNTKETAYKAWRETLSFIGVSGEVIQAKRPNLASVFSKLVRVAKKEDILPDVLKQFLEELERSYAEMTGLLGDTLGLFKEVYRPYLEEFDDAECEEIRNNVVTQGDIFLLAATTSNQRVKDAADLYRKNQVRTQLFNLWKEKTGTKTPRAWSEKYETPILCCIEAENYNEAKKAFAVLNSAMSCESEIKAALQFLENATFFDLLEDKEHRDYSFMNSVVGDYSTLLKDLSVIRSALSELSVNAYDWADDPTVKEKIRKMASAEYHAGGSDNVVNTIEAMNEDELRDWLKGLIMKDMDLGVKIIRNGGR